MKIVDHSDRIARMQVNVELLREWHPTGKWRNHALLNAYLADHYCLSMAQAKQLDKFLASEVAQAVGDRRYVQLQIPME